MDVQAADAGRREVAGEGHQRGGMSRREVTRTVRRRDGVGLPTKPTSAVARQAIQCRGVTMTIVWVRFFVRFGFVCESFVCESIKLMKMLWIEWIELCVSYVYAVNWFAWFLQE
jgi:hypothetical protein